MSDTSNDELTVEQIIDLVEGLHNKKRDERKKLAELKTSMNGQKEKFRRAERVIDAIEGVEHVSLFSVAFKFAIVTLVAAAGVRIIVNMVRD